MNYPYYGNPYMSPMQDNLAQLRQQQMQAIPPMPQNPLPQRGVQWVIPNGSISMSVCSQAVRRYPSPLLKLYAFLQNDSGTQSSQTFAIQIPDSMDVLHSSTQFGG